MVDLEYWRERRRIREESGCCPKCGRPNNSKYRRCDRCREVDKALKKKRKDEGKCVACGKPKLLGESTVCCQNCAEGVFKFIWN